MALLSFADSTPRAYRLKAGNACPPISTLIGTFPIPDQRGDFASAPEVSWNEPAMAYSSASS
jgi:hypothetical protein